jgi:type IV secretory pathway VirD2 relaxase
VIFSPDPASGRTLPLQEVVQAWMVQVEADLGAKIDWLGAVHYDEDVLHVQMSWSGKSLSGELIWIAREYISAGLRSRAAQIVDLYRGLGHV